MPRPIQTIKRNKKYTVRFTLSEEIILKRTAAKFGITVSEYIRARVSNISIKPIMNDAEIQTYRNLVGLANNLNQLTKSANQGVMLQDEIQFTLERINEALDKIK